MRTIGLDLAIQATHKAVVADEFGRYLTPVLTLHTRPSALHQVFARAREGTADPALQVVMEPTGMAWLPVAAFCAQHGVPIYLVKRQEVADLRRYYTRHAKSDRIDARVLARLPVVNPDTLYRLVLPSATALACQRACKQLDRLATQITAIQNRLQAIDRFAWPGLETVGFTAPCAPAPRWFRQHWYNPHLVVREGSGAIRAQWWADAIDADDPAFWADALVALAADVVALYGSNGTYVDFAELHAEVRREQVALERLEEQHHTLRLETEQPLYRQLHPSRNLETIKGIGPDGAAVYASFIGDPQRFSSTRLFRGWTGMVPASAQSADNEAKGLHITQAGPDLIKKFAYINAEVARQWDPQIAAIYYTQIMCRGKHHTQAVCACATHLLDRVLAVLRSDQPYELRDVDGTPVTWQEAQAIIAKRYTVPEEVRRRATKRQRQAQHEWRTEHKYERESRSRIARGKSETSTGLSRPSPRSV